MEPVSPEALAAVRDAARTPPPVEVRWTAQARTAVLYPALAPWCLEDSKEARLREVRHRFLEECLQAALLLTPHPSVGNVIPAWLAEPETGTAAHGTGT